MSAKDTVRAVRDALKPTTTGETVMAVVTPGLYTLIKVAEGFVERAREKKGLKATDETTSRRKTAS